MNIVPATPTVRTFGNTEVSVEGLTSMALSPEWLETELRLLAKRLGDKMPEKIIWWTCLFCEL
jgi:hypothetical protein